MNRRSLLLLIAAGLVVSTGSASESAKTLDLSGAVNGAGWGVHNRSVSLLDEDGKKGVRLDTKENDGIVWLKESEFENGIIEIDIRGKNLPGRSFVGVAFHGVDENTYEAVYFRPFNFKNVDQERRSHSMQYISHPEHTWNKLRDEHPGQYENELVTVPDPDGWFHARIEVNGKKVSVFVNDDKEPSMEVERIPERKKGWIGVWVGNGSAGDFANLTVKEIVQD